MSSYGTLSPIEVRVEVLNCSDNCQKFTLCCAVIAFTFTEFTVVIGYDSFPRHCELEKELPLRT